MELEWVARSKGREQAIACISMGTTWVVLWLSGTQSAPAVTGVLVGTGEAPRQTFVQQLPKMPDTGHLTAATLRGLPLDRLIETYQRGFETDATLIDPNQPVRLLHQDIDLQAAQQMGYRSVRDLRAAIDRATVAQMYCHFTGSGERAPVTVTAVAMGVDEKKVRNMLHLARRDGLLTSSGGGRRGGDMTEKGKRLLAFGMIEHADAAAAQQRLAEYRRRSE